MSGWLIWAAICYAAGGAVTLLIVMQLPTDMSRFEKLVCAVFWPLVLTSLFRS